MHDPNMVTSGRTTSVSGDMGEGEQGEILIVSSEPSTPPEFDPRLYRLYLVENEETSVLVEARRLTMVRGQMLAISPWESVMFDPDARVIALAFHHNFFCVKVLRHEVFCDGVVFNRLMGTPVITMPSAEWPLLRARFAELRQIAGSPSPLRDERAIGSLRALLLQMADSKLRSVPKADEEGVRVGMLSDLVLRFQDLLETRFQEGQDTEFFADALGVTMSTLNRRVKAELGQTVRQAMNERLAVEARLQLRGGQKPIKQVAFDLGFDDPLYFSRFFKKHFGKAPSNYFVTEDPSAPSD